MNSIFTLDYNPPKDLVTTEFMLLPSHEKYNQYDYVAIMRNMEMLRTWSQSSWPEDDFAPKQNKENLALYMEDNRTHSAYCFMMFEPEFARSYGNIYVYSFDAVKENFEMSAEQENDIGQYDALVDFWVIEDGSDLEKIITEELREWFKNVWKINVLFSARVGLDKRIRIYDELEMKCVMKLKSKTSDMNLLLF